MGKSKIDEWWHEKSAATRIGITLDEYLAHRDAGEKWCMRCRAWHKTEAFGVDPGRYDSLVSACRTSRHTGHPRGWHERPLINPKTGRPGAERLPRRDGDEKQARSRINHDVDQGLRPRPDDLPCTDCGHVWAPGKRRHEYDHYLGYAAEHHYDVQAVCSSCHRRREWMRRKRG